MVDAANRNLQGADADHMHLYGGNHSKHGHTEETVYHDRTSAERGIHVAESTEVHIVLPHDGQQLDIGGVGANQSGSGDGSDFSGILNRVGSSSSSPGTLAQSPSPASLSAASNTSSLSSAVWMSPILQFEGCAPGDLRSPDATRALSSFLAGQTLQGGYSPGGLPARVHTSGKETAPPSSSSSSSSLPPPSAAAATTASSATATAPVAGTSAGGVRTRFTLRTRREGALVMWFYLVRPDSQSALDANAARREALKGKAPPSSLPSSTGDASSSDDEEGAAGQLARLVSHAGFGVLPPHSDDVIATACVPIQVYARPPSPVLSSILDACDPRPEESAAVAALRVLAATIARMTGMVNGKKSHQVQAAAAAAALAGRSSGSGGSASLTARDQIHDDETFLTVMRHVTAVLHLNRASAADPAALPAPPDGHLAPSPDDHGGAGADADATSTAIAAGAASSASTDVSDVDALAALIAAMEQGPEGEESIEDLSRGGPGHGVQRGGSAADADADAAGRQSRQRYKKHVSWVSHLARHPYFADVNYESGAIIDDYTNYSLPLQRMAARLAQEQTAAHGGGGVGGRRGSTVAVGT